MFILCVGLCQMAEKSKFKNKQKVQNCWSAKNYTWGNTKFTVICQHFNWDKLNGQGRSQPHSPGWARVPLSSFFPQISINFSYFSSNFIYFLPHFGPPGGQLAHPGRPWLRHCEWENMPLIMGQIIIGKLVNGTCRAVDAFLPFWTVTKCFLWFPFAHGAPLASMHISVPVKAVCREIGWAVWKIGPTEFFENV